MSICGTIEQGESLILRIFDNKMRENAAVRAIVHAGDQTKEIVATNFNGTFAYEIQISDNIVQTQVVDILVDDEPISQSPIRVMVKERNCIDEYGSKRVANAEGECVCSSETYPMGDRCIESAYFFLIICKWYRRCKSVSLHKACLISFPKSVQQASSPPFFFVAS